GCGSIGHSHAAAIRAMREATLALVVDVDETRARTFGEKYGADHMTDVGAALERNDVDAVVVATANNLHPPITTAAMNAGKHVLVQKPMALSLEEADQMLEAEARSGKRLMVSFFQLFHPAVTRAREIISQGLIGDVFLFKGFMGWYVPVPSKGWRFDPAV